MSKNKHILDKAVLPAPESNRYFRCWSAILIYAVCCFACC